MKKILCILLAAALTALLPLSALSEPGFERDPENGSIIYGFYFENNEDIAAWTNIDADGDGESWRWYPLAGTEYCYEGLGFMLSYSYEAGALTPDNWLISPATAIPSGETQVSIYIGGYGNYPYEHFAVYAGPTLEADAMVQIIPETVTGMNYVRYIADISDFAGNEVYIAVRHFNCTDQNYLRVDRFEIWNIAGQSALPGDVNLNGAVETADALIALRTSMGLVQLNDQQLSAADMDGNGSVTISDAITILRLALGL